MLDLQELRDLDDLLDQIYDESINNQNYQALIKTAISKNENQKSTFGSSQIRSLETLAYATTNVSDVKNYIKNQVGKDSNNKNWAKAVIDKKCFGTILLEEISQVEQKAIKKNNITEFKLKVLRGFIHQFVSEYLYRVKEDGSK